jgi:quercetin dioxygenase-like cupin family protein
MGLAEKYKNDIGRFDYDLMITHFMDGKVGIKRMEIPAGATALSHKHKYDHYSIVTGGKFSVMEDGGQKVVYHPDSVVRIKAGVLHEICAIEDITVFCIHAMSETDGDKFDQVAIGYV